MTKEKKGFKGISFFVIIIVMLLGGLFVSSAKLNKVFAWYDPDLDISTLQLIIDAAESGDTITLNANYGNCTDQVENVVQNKLQAIPSAELNINKPLTIDLNGHYLFAITINICPANSTDVVVIENSLEYGSINQNYGYDASVVDTGTINVLNGEVSLNNLEVYSPAKDSNAKTIVVSAGHLTINGGNYSSNGDSGSDVVFSNGGNVVINGATCIHEKNILLYPTVSDTGYALSGNSSNISIVSGYFETMGNYTALHLDNDIATQAAADAFCDASTNAYVSRFENGGKIVEYFGDVFSSDINVVNVGSTYT